ncbi:TLR4 interactor with leucine rich repeats-like [Drosophila sulfurigaster albostrigata]|uniref:TLR4 interactor with leucine rich repeats-like n=1 Tax=Drosophila sulfurigaster albostrigata TaxID=89887 RepID=UPI002D21D8CA|nr:TLR4 interactor with leucine rich repeats-like [Drosophila sulfurigaster albostrigata]
MSFLNLSILWLICCVATAATQTCQIEDSKFYSLKCQELSSLEEINDFPTKKLCGLEIINTQTKLTIGTVNSSLNMPRLSFLYLSHVPRLELLSEGFSNLPYLMHLNISGCGVEQLLASHFPTVCPIIEFDTSDNKLSVLTKDLLSKFSKLIFAVFANNSLTHVEVPYMRSLGILDLSHNNLTTFNITLGNCPYLRKLYLNNNKLTQFQITLPAEVVDSSVEKVLRLKKLDLSNNCISELIENQFELLGELEILELSGNRITTLKSAHFAGLTSLRHLHLASNYNMELIGHTFEALEQLETLDLSYIFLENLSPHLFGFKQVNKKGRYKYLPMVHMRKLSLTGNMLQHLHPRTFKKLPFLDTLLLADNALRVLPAGLFVPIRNLRMLDVGHNQLIKISRDLLEALSKITVLQIDYNQLSYLPDLNGTLPNLVRMDVEGNPWQCDLFAQTERWLISRKIAYIKHDYDCI